MSKGMAALAFVVLVAAGLWAEDLYAVGLAAARTVIDAQLALYVDGQGLRIGCL
jgi:uncharacterized membrane protein YpjA